MWNEFLSNLKLISKQSQQPGDPREFPVMIHGQGLGKIPLDDHRTQRKMIHGTVPHWYGQFRRQRYGKSSWTREKPVCYTISQYKNNIKL